MPDCRDDVDAAPNCRKLVCHAVMLVFGGPHPTEYEKSPGTNFHIRRRRR